MGIFNDFPSIISNFPKTNFKEFKRFLAFLNQIVKKTKLLQLN